MKTKKQALEWSPTLLDNGAVKTSSEWKVWLASDKNVEKWRLPSSKEYNERIKNLSDNENDIHFKECFRKYWLLTNETIIDFDKKERALWVGSLLSRSLLLGISYLCSLGRVFGVRDKK